MDTYEQTKNRQRGPRSVLIVRHAAFVEVLFSPTTLSLFTLYSQVQECFWRITMLTHGIIIELLGHTCFLICFLMAKATTSNCP